MIQVHARTFDIISVELGELVMLPDEVAAVRLDQRLAVWGQIDRLQEHSIVERGIIINEFETRRLWSFLIDPDTGKPFPNLTAWLSCSTYLGCRRTNFEARSLLGRLADVPPQKLIDIPKATLHTMTQLSTQVRNDPQVLEDARTLTSEQFEEKIEREHPQQHLERRTPMRFSPGRSWAKTIEEAITWALEHDIAGTRDEALLKMAETALNDWRLDEEIAQERRTEQEVPA